uniref:CSON006554 protein n=1 Tax=Culicoides sonorensis TaxID=179676 RepID=A0A336MUW5_CULSO
MKFQLLLVLSIAFHTYTSSSRLPLENRIVGAFKMKLKLFVILFVASVIRASPPNLGFFNPRYSFSERIVGGKFSFQFVEFKKQFIFISRQCC